MKVLALVLLLFSSAAFGQQPTKIPFATAFRDLLASSPRYVYVGESRGAPGYGRFKCSSPLLSASAALQEIREAKDVFVVFSQRKPHLTIFL
jgi:hypothetical protein